jgi:hypothetical protein
MGTEPKNGFFYHFTKIKVGGGCFCAHMYAYNVFFEKNFSFGLFMKV